MPTFPLLVSSVPSIIMDWIEDRYKARWGLRLGGMYCHSSEIVCEAFWDDNSVAW